MCVCVCEVEQRMNSDKRHAVVEDAFGKGLCMQLLLELDLSFR